MHPVVFLVGRVNSQKSVPPDSAAAVEEFTQTTIGAVQNGKRQRQRLLRERLPSAERWVVHPDLPPSQKTKEDKSVHRAGQSGNWLEPRFPLGRVVKIMEANPNMEWCSKVS